MTVIGEIQVVNQASDAFAIQQMTRGEIDSAIATAREFPRDIERFQKNAAMMALVDEDTAASCFYALDRGGKAIEGPSVRMAEIIATQYGNLRFGSRIVEIGEKFVTVLGVCHDLETNVAAQVDVSRRITNRRGERFNDDMIMVTQNAALAIAFRNAVFRVIPRVYTEELFRACKAKVRGGDDPGKLNERRRQMIQYFGNLGVAESDILRYLRRDSVEKIDADNLVHMRGVATAITEAYSSIYDIFGGRARSSDLDPDAPPVEDPLFTDADIDKALGS